MEFDVLAAARSDFSSSAPMAHLSYIHHVAERGSESGQACEDDGYFYLAETDAGITVKVLTQASGLTFKRILVLENVIISLQKQPISVPTSNIQNIHPCLCLIHL